MTHCGILQRSILVVALYAIVGYNGKKQNSKLQFIEPLQFFS